MVTGPQSLAREVALVIKEFKISVEQGRVVATLFSVVDFDHDAM